MQILATERKTKKELLALSGSVIEETAATRRLELKLILVQEKTIEIRDIWNNYNDESLKQTMDELE